jgi:hypothetical protein
MSPGPSERKVKDKDAPGGFRMEPIPPINAAEILGHPNATAIMSDQHRKRSVQELRLGADAASIVVVPGYSRADRRVIAKIREDIHPDLLEAVARILVGVTGISTIKSKLSPEEKGLAAMLPDLLKFSEVANRDDLDATFSKIDQAEQIVIDRGGK